MPCLSCLLLAASFFFVFFSLTSRKIVNNNLLDCLSSIDTSENFPVRCQYSSYLELNPCLRW
jgi:hypothetical protein